SAPSVTDVEGTVTLAIANFVSITGSFGLQKFTDTSGATYLAVGASDLNIVLGNNTTNLTVADASLGPVIKPSNSTTPTRTATPDFPPTTSASAVTQTGSVVVTPATMEPYIVKGANLVINEGLADQETVTVTAVTTSTFTAKFAQTHNANFTIGDNS